MVRVAVLLFNALVNTRWFTSTGLLETRHAHGLTYRQRNSFLSPEEVRVCAPVSPVPLSPLTILSLQSPVPSVCPLWKRITLLKPL